MYKLSNNLVATNPIYDSNCVQTKYNNQLVEQSDQLLSKLIDLHYIRIIQDFELFYLL